MSNRRLFALPIAVALAACGPNASDCIDVPEVPAADADAAFEFVTCRRYIDSPAETERHGTSSPHGDETRVWINHTMEEALMANATEMPVGSVSTKEIYSNGAQQGWALMVKVAAGTSADTWYWYEVLGSEPGTEPVVAAVGASACTGCHSAGTDYFRTFFPLR